VLLLVEFDHVVEEDAHHLLFLLHQGARGGVFGWGLFEQVLVVRLIVPAFGFEIFHPQRQKGRFHETGVFALEVFVAGRAAFFVRNE
jgi:hypothetical protein